MAESFLLSPCCQAKIIMSRTRGVDIGVCGKCDLLLIRVNPTTGKREWLDENLATTQRKLRPVVATDYQYGPNPYKGMIIKK